MKSLVTLGLLLWSSLVFSNQGYDRMEALGDRTKNILLTRAIVAHKLPCETVVKSIAQGEDRQGDGYWTAFCADGQSYSVRVTSNDASSIRVSQCGELSESQLACSEDTTSLAAE